MNIDQVVINTLVFEDALNKGIQQHKLFSGIHDLGVKNVEVRREYILDDADLKLIKQTADRYGLGVFYSIPDTFFSEGKLNRDQLKKYIEEAQTINAQMIKLTVGDFNGWTAEDIEAYHAITQDYKGIVTVENDQTNLSGKMKALLLFLDECNVKNIPIFSTFDVGNWYWVNDDPMACAPKLSRFTRFVHLKDVMLSNVTPKATYLGDGVIPWLDVLRIFDEDVHVAIEYPCGEKPFEVLESELSKLLHQN